MSSDINAACGKILQKVLMASFVYYQLHKNVMPDEEYDQLCKVLLKYYDQFEHQHKYLVTKDDLEAGTLYALAFDAYPMVVRFATEKWLLNGK